MRRYLSSTKCVAKGILNREILPGPEDARICFKTRDISEIQRSILLIMIICEILLLILIYLFFCKLISTMCGAGAGSYGKAVTCGVNSKILVNTGTLIILMYNFKDAICQMCRSML